MIYIHNFLTGFSMLLLLSTSFSCQSEPPTDLSKAALIPHPQQIEVSGKNFELNTKSKIIIPSGQPKIAALGDYLHDVIQERTGLDLGIQSTEPGWGETGITLSYIENDQELNGQEDYGLSIDPKQVSIYSPFPDGIFRGIQTLLQLIPVDQSENEEPQWKIPTGFITDSPQYAYRGMMLDVSRHFFSVADVKRVIDLIAMCKINHLHLHLADDQGWRIEIKSWPRLTEHGGSTEVGGGPGGFYTQEEYSEIVRYATARYITIVPEIDMPGHTNAALASYPELNCNGVSPGLYTGTKVGFSTLCTSKEIVYQFVDDVVRELAELTPGPYIHIGGDESHVTALKDYIPFIERVNDIVNKYDKQVIGWDEISHAQLTAGSVVQYWANADNAKRGVEKGARVLLSPAHKVYLDMQYDSTTELGLHWAAYIEVDSAYQWVPEELVKGLDPESIIGIESPLWSETVTKMDEIEYMIFPRLLAHAELGWSIPGARNWSDFKRRLQGLLPHLDQLEVDYYHSPKLK